MRMSRGRETSFFTGGVRARVQCLHVFKIVARGRRCTAFFEVISLRRHKACSRCAPVENLLNGLAEAGEGHADHRWVGAEDETNAAPGWCSHTAEDERRRALPPTWSSARRAERGLPRWRRARVCVDLAAANGDGMRLMECIIAPAGGENNAGTMYSSMDVLYCSHDLRWRITHLQTNHNMRESRKV